MIDEVVTLAVHRVLESPAIREAVYEESSHLMEDLVDDTRARALAADDAAERVARKTFRRGRPRPAPKDADRPPAGFVSRAVAFALDAWLLTLGVGAGTVLASSILGVLVPRVSGADVRNLVPAAIGGVIVVAYFVACWAAWGRTLGDALLGLQVVTRDGGPVSLPRSILRYVMLVVSSLALFLGLLWVLIDDRRLGWLDHVAGTQVVAVPRTLGLPRRAPAHEARGRRPPERQRRATDLVTRPVAETAGPSSATARPPSRRASRRARPRPSMALPAG